MQNAQIASRIKEICKLRKTSITQMLVECDLTKSFIYDLEKRDASPSCEKITKIADYLEVSVDYLLGRVTDYDNYSNNIITTGDLNGNNQVSMNIGKQEHSQADVELLELINGLSLVQRAKVIVMINEMKSET